MELVRACVRAGGRVHPRAGAAASAPWGAWGVWRRALACLHTVRSYWSPAPPHPLSRSRRARAHAGHKIKNPRMQLRAHLDALPAASRIIISGTPIQNNLLEARGACSFGGGGGAALTCLACPRARPPPSLLLHPLAQMHTLFSFCTPGLLEDARTFKERYERVITHGSDKQATGRERAAGAAAAERLRALIGPYMLRREKREVFKPTSAAAAGEGGGGEAHEQQQGGAGSSGAAAGGGPSSSSGSSGAPAVGGSQPGGMPHKNDLIVWLRLQPMQRRVYEAFLNSGERCMHVWAPPPCRACGMRHPEPLPARPCRAHARTLDASPSNPALQML